MSIQVYHGSTATVEQPLCDYGRKGVDFGTGFYVSDMREQAVSWAKVLEFRRDLPALLNVYQFEKELYMKESRCKRFERYDSEWLTFVVQNRLGIYSGEEYDYVEGGVANDRVVGTVNMYIKGIITEEKALEELAFHKPNNQICLNNQALVNKYLHYVTTDRL